MENPSSNTSNTSRDLVIIIVIIALLCCVIVAIGAAGYYFYDQSQTQNSLNGTSTAEARAQVQATNQAYATGTAVVVATQAQATSVAQATQQAEATATVQARINARTEYDLIDTFDNNDTLWRSGDEDNDYWTGSTSIEDGHYIWDVTEAKDTFISWGSYESQEVIRDFDVYVEAKLVTGDPAQHCYGIMFRENPDGLDSGGYIFSICQNGYFDVSYKGADGWETISDWLEAPQINADDWNLLEISARGEHVVFRINNETVYEMDDDRQLEGYISLYIDLYEASPTTIWFDNFGLDIP